MKNLKYLSLCLFISPCMVMAQAPAAISVTNTFSSNTAISAAQMNANFQAIVNGTNALIPTGGAIGDVLTKHANGSHVWSAPSVPSLSNTADLSFTSDSNGDTSGALIFNTAAIERMRILNNGNVGVGNVNPVEKLDVTGNIALSGKARFKSSNANHVELIAPAGLAATLTFTLPASAGVAGNVLSVDGAGNMSWIVAPGGAPTGAAGGDLSGSYPNPVINGLTATKISGGLIDNVEFDYLNGVTSTIQTQIDNKESTITGGLTSQFFRGDKIWATLNTTAVPEGSNLYFLDSRVRAALLSGYAVGSAIPLTMTDTLLEALGKLEAQIIANNAAFDASGQWSKSGSNYYYNAGNIGIGTSTPVFPLDVAGSIRAGASVKSPILSNATDLTLASDNDFNSSGALVFMTGPNERMRIKNTGEIGIGTLTPQSVLDINSTTSGILIPRMITPQRDAIPSPVAGMQIYNTSTNELNYYNGTSWNSLAAAGMPANFLNTGGSQFTAGYDNTNKTVMDVDFQGFTTFTSYGGNPGYEFIGGSGGFKFSNGGLDILGNNTAPLIAANSPNGTGDLIDLKNAGVSKFIVKADGKVGIGTSTPIGMLEIKGHSTNLTFVASINDFSLQVTSTAGFPQSGNLQIHDEILPYTIVNGTTFSLSSPVTVSHSNSSEVKLAEKILLNSGNVGIGRTNPSSALHVKGYIQLDLVPSAGTAPPASDCTASTRGRMIFDDQTDNLYICGNGNIWVVK